MRPPPAPMDDFWATYAGPGLLLTAEALLVIAPLLVLVAMLTWFERKVMAAMQLRMGTNVVGPFGLLQPCADALKMIVKETIIPTKANPVVFILAPMLTFFLAVIGWAVI